MKLGGFTITTENGIGTDSSELPSDTIAPVLMMVPGILPPSLRNMYFAPGPSLLSGQPELSRAPEHDASKSSYAEYESSSGSDNTEEACGDEQEPNQVRRGKKRYHRHGSSQIQEMEAFFQEVPHPDEKQRHALSQRLNLKAHQVKFWFQNRRTQMKTQQERQDCAFLRQVNETLRAENTTLRNSMRKACCPTCRGPSSIEMSIEEEQLRFGSALMRDELERLYAMDESIHNSKPVSTIISSVTQPPCRSSVGSNFGALAAGRGCDLVPGASITERVSPKSSTLLNYDKGSAAELAMVAMDEFLQMARFGEPLWMCSLGCGNESLDISEYIRHFPRGKGHNNLGYRSEATRATGVVRMNGASIVDAFLDVSRWVDMFPGIVRKAEVGDVISSGVPMTRHGALQLMSAELQLLSPLVLARGIYFVRFCQLVQDNVWAVVDVSADNLRSDSPREDRVYRRPSGCLIQEMPNGHCKVTWVEHSEYPDRAVHHLYRSLVYSGIAFGAHRWLAMLQSQSERLVILMANSIANKDSGGLPTPEGRRSILKLAQRMIANFCKSVCGSSVGWLKLSCDDDDKNEVRILPHKDNPRDPCGMVLSAATSIWLPMVQKHLFEFLRNENRRKEWDVLAGDRPMQEMIHIAKGQDTGNYVSLLRTFQGGANNILILQETCTDSSGSLVVYAPVDIQSMNAVMTGGDQNLVTILPSGFAILPDGSECRSLALLSDSGSTLVDTLVGGSLLTVAFQIVVNSLPGSVLTLESINTVNSLVSNTVKHIKQALQFEEPSRRSLPLSTSPGSE